MHKRSNNDLPVVAGIGQIRMADELLLANEGLLKGEKRKEKSNGLFVS